MAELLPYEPRAQAPTLTTPMEMLAIAVEGGADVAVLEKLMTLQERYEANRGRAEFDRAMAAAKAEIGPIVKTREVDFTSAKGRTNYKFEDLATIARAVDPVLARHGLSYRFRTAQDGQRVSVTCIIAHRDGHFEENTLATNEDHTGNKNPIQAIGSAVTYLQRYTLKAALGLSASEDDGGQAAGGSCISMEQAEELDALLRKYGADPAKFYRSKGATGPGDLPASKFNDAKASLIRWGEAQTARGGDDATGN